MELFKSHLSRGVAHLKIGELDEALADFNETVALGDNPGRACFYRGIANFNKGNFHAAIDDLTESIRFDSKRGAAFLARAIAHTELGEENEAEKDLVTAYGLNNTEIGSFMDEYAISRNMFERSMALFDGDRGPWKIVLTDDEVIRMNEWQ
jgi:tetratricopeptide (TPR) repeat protein